MILTLRNLLGKIGIDGPIFFTLVTRVFQGLGGFITIFLIAHFMSKEEQGYYYTFASVLAIQIFFELGFGGIIVQFVAHEMSNLTVSSTNFFAGNRKSLSRLSSLLKFCIKWYAVFAALLFLCLHGVSPRFLNVSYGFATPPSARRHGGTTQGMDAGIRASASLTKLSEAALARARP
jgi:O-antigen/teichoic acid export membrane protein